MADEEAARSSSRSAEQLAERSEPPRKELHTPRAPALPRIAASQPSPHPTRKVRPTARHARLKGTRSDTASMGQTAREVIFLRDKYAGKGGNMCRGDYDDQIAGIDAENAELANYRAHCRQVAEQAERDKAGRWRMEKQRERNIMQMRWQLAEAGICAGAGPGEEGTKTIHVSEPPTPPPTRKGKLMRYRRHVEKKMMAKQLRERNHLESSASSAEEETPADKTPPRVEPLWVRLKAARKIGKQWHHRAMVGPGPVIRRERSTVGEIASSVRRGTVVGQKHMEDFLGDASAIELFTVTTKHRDRKAYLRVFSSYDRDDSGSLDKVELRDCLSDLGLRGTNEDERAEIRSILSITSHAEVGFHEFCHVLVPRVRQRLTELKSERLERMFKQADEDGSGLLSVNELATHVRLEGLLLPQEGGVDLVLETIGDCRPKVLERIKPLEGGLLLDADCVDFACFRHVVPLLQERQARHSAEQYRSIVDLYDLTKEDYKEIGKELLIEMHNAFQQRAAFSKLPAASPPDSPQGDAESGEPAPIQHGTIEQSHVVRVFKDASLLPYGPPKRAEATIEAVLKTAIAPEKPLTFPEFIYVVSLVRATDRRKFEHGFGLHDFNGNGSLSLIEVGHALQACDLVPRDKREADIINSSVHDFDEDDSGELDREEFVKLCYYTNERLRRIRPEADRLVAQQCGFSEKKTEEFRKAFSELDADSNDLLEREEVDHVLELLKLKPANPNTDQLFVEAGFDPRKPGGLRLTFSDFLRVMHALESMHAKPPAPARVVPANKFAGIAKLACL